MKRLVMVVLGLTCASLVSANMLVNPGFETAEGGSGGNGRTPDGWWAYNDAVSEGWAAMSGTNGVAFRAWNDTSYGGMGQDVLVDRANGDVFEFSIYGRAEADYSSTANETWLKLEFWNSAGDQLYYAVTNDIYSAMVSDPDNWNQYIFRYTNDNVNVGMVKPMFGGGEWSNTGGDQAATWDDASFVQIPEPVTAGLLLIGLGGVYMFRRRK
ncbi:MAG: PEP-CTERM sorting domain-containing protein [Spartobacteria bacterium]|nr:PEP-CTERM sorting domain-containing protein [Spartobacteria bacterium]